MNRRSFIKRAATTGGGVIATGAGLTPAAEAKRKPVRAHTERPNILVIMVDELRVPTWFPSQTKLDELLPNLARLRRVATSFENHYTASNMCVAARGTLLTGLYSQQTGCMLTKLLTESTLSPEFPTWGTMLRQQGYETAWYGKWHLGPEPDDTPGGLEAYGFDGGTYPSPNGDPEQGVQMDPKITDQFIDWFADKPRSPWSATVSFVNPHDINWWPRFTTSNETEAQQSSGYTFGSVPLNIETSEQLQATKPRLQTALQQTIGLACGVVPDVGSVDSSLWLNDLQLYLWYQEQVDAQIGRVLDTLYAEPKVAANTIIVFTADHGEYAGSHGLRTKGGGVYEEAIHVPLYVVDPRGVYSNGRASVRTQFTSSVDIAPLMLTLAHGSSGWRSEARYSHIAGRADIAAIARNKRTAGRPWIAHATDETTVEELSYSYSWANECPHHVTAIRTSSAKYANYAYWNSGTLNVEPGDQDLELYDYGTTAGRLELDNIAGAAPALLGKMQELLEEKVIPDEIRKPLPKALHEAQEQGFANFYSVTSNPEP
ncbi:MAG TPA: sulfatase-like hydrolase/transferase [Solirubrobacteraceae bacterium]|nr:sulfatase-like hydrolase/transferase [Solirubrobacteraceae bacterium]